MIPCPKSHDRQHAVDPAKQGTRDNCACGMSFHPQWNEPTREQVIAATEPTAAQVTEAQR